jgi:hypothetical protein
MRPASTALPLSVLTALLFACESGGEPLAVNDPLASAPASTPSFGAAVERIPFNFFFLQDFDRDISATVGLVSPVSDLGTEPDCGGSGPEVYDGGGIERLVETPAGSFHLRDGMQKATFVLYEGATIDVCELTTHPVVARGTVNFHFSIKISPDNALHLQVTFNGFVDLTSGGRAKLLSTANAVFGSDGSLTIHVDRFELKPIGG